MKAIISLGKCCPFLPFLSIPQGHGGPFLLENIFVLDSRSLLVTWYQRRRREEKVGVSAFGGKNLIRVQTFWLTYDYCTAATVTFFP
jgi:hypothetical protein